MNGKVARTLRQYAKLHLRRRPDGQQRPLKHAEQRAAKRDWRAMNHKQRGKARRLLGRLLRRAREQGIASNEPLPAAPTIHIERAR